MDASASRPLWWRRQASAPHLLQTNRWSYWSHDAQPHRKRSTPCFRSRAQRSHTWMSRGRQFGIKASYC